MTLINGLTNQVDIPMWVQTAPCPIATVAGNALTSCDDGTDRYFYYMGYSGTSSFFYRYDTVADTWQQLASPNITQVVGTSLKYSQFGGYRGNCLGATSNTMNLAGLNGDILKGFKIRITEGAGKGQERTITSITDAQIKDHGVLTAVANNYITDSTKRWKINQWVGSQVRVVFGTGLAQVRKVLYNNENTLYFYDVNYQQLEPWNNTVFSATAPYAVPVTTAGLQGHYVIEQSTITVDTNWDVTPDWTSSYAILSGGIWAFSSATGSPWSTFQYYDIASDTWTTKTPLGTLTASQYGTDFVIERTGEIGGTFDSGTATSALSKSLTDTSKNLKYGRYSNFQIRIVAGTGKGQRRRVIHNTSNTFFTEIGWDTIPDNTSVYEIYGDTDNIYLMGGGLSTIFKYSVEKDIWSNASTFDYGTIRQGAAYFGGQEAISVNSITRTASGITAVASAPTAGGTGYKIGDVLTVTGGSAKVYVENVNAGVVTSVSLYASSGGYTTGTGKATTGGSGSGCTINITSVGTIGIAATTINHNFAIGDTVTLTGFTESAYNTTVTINGTSSLTDFSFITTATSNASFSNAITTSLMVDSTKNWAVNEHAGRLIIIQTAGTGQTTQIRRIVSNTATTITLQSAITAAGNGTSRYVIECPMGLGRDEQYRVPTLSGNGNATGGSTTTLVDSSKNWISNQWAGYKFRILAGTGQGNEVTITSNDATTLTYSTQTFTPDITTKYLVMDTFGLATSGSTTTIVDTFKNWAVNQWAGKRVRITSGTGYALEATISSNTNNTLTISTLSVAVDNTTTYTILGNTVRSTSPSCLWIYGNSNVDTKGNKIIAARGGGSNFFDIYDITTEMWDFTKFVTPQQELLATGTMYCYDDSNRVYFTVASTNRVFYLDVNTLTVHGCGMTPAQGGAIIGNRMEMVTTADGLKYLYIMKHSDIYMWRSLIWW